MFTHARIVRGERAYTSDRGASSDASTPRASAPTKSFSVIQGGIPKGRTPAKNERDSLRRFFDAEFQTAIVAMCAQMRRQPTRTFYEIRRDGTRNLRPWSLLLRTIDEAIVAGAPLDRVQVLADLLRDYVTARGLERPETPIEAAIAESELRSA